MRGEKVRKKEQVDVVACISDVLQSIKKGNALSKLQVIDITKNIPCYDTGNIALNYLFSCGGAPLAKCIEISGVAASGKTTLSQFIMAAIQKGTKKTTVWLDVEKAFEPRFAVRLGVDPEKLLISEPDTGEEVFKELYSLIQIPEIGAIVVDSIAAMVSEEELADSNKWGLLASMLSKGLKKLNGKCTKDSPPIFFINQIRDNIGVTFGEKTKSVGGKALPHYMAVRIKATFKSKIKDSKTGKVIGVVSNFKTVKNKVGYPFREIELEIDYRNGISRTSGLLKLLVEFGIVKKTSTKGTYKYKDREFKKAELLEVYEANPEIWTELNEL